jgi:hypothetical protein
VVGWWIKEGDLVDDIWLIDFIYLYEREVKKNPCNCFNCSGGWDEREG